MSTARRHPDDGGDGGPITFALPTLDVVLDCETGNGESTLPCAPVALVILSDEHRFYVV